MSFRPFFMPWSVSYMALPTTGVRLSVCLPQSRNRS
jgi:hypothetical protein